MKDNINQLKSINDIMLNCAQSISSSINWFSSIKLECDLAIQEIIIRSSSYIDELSESIDYYNKQIEQYNTLSYYNNQRI